jgi:hypothetical protein
MRAIVQSIALLILIAPAYGATARWTGRQEPVMTVTYQQAWNCEYDYLGQRFWRAFKRSCPRTVEVM